MVFKAFVNCFIAPIFTFILAQAQIDKVYLNSFFFAFLVLLFLPEVCLMIFPKFRAWMRMLVEDGDGIPNKSDLKEAVVHYIALILVRVCSVGLLWSYWFNPNIPAWSIWTPLITALTFEGFQVWGKKMHLPQ